MNEHIEKLKAARGRMVEDRRDTVSTLAKEHSQKTPDAWKDILVIQSAIDAIDRALQDEANIAKCGEDAHPALLFLPLEGPATIRASPVGGGAVRAVEPAVLNKPKFMRPKASVSTGAFSI